MAYSASGQTQVLGRSPAITAWVKTWCAWWEKCVWQRGNTQRTWEWENQRNPKRFVVQYNSEDTDSEDGVMDLRMWALQDLTFEMLSIWEEMAMQLALMWEQLEMSREHSGFLKDMALSQYYMAGMLCRIGKGKIVLMTCRVEDEMKVLVELEKSWRRFQRTN